MARSRATLRELARQASLEEDDALLMLWEIGLDVSSPLQILRGRQYEIARSALRIPNARMLREVAYLARIAELSELETRQRLRSGGVLLIDDRRIPRGSFSQAKKILDIQSAVAPDLDGLDEATEADKLTATFELPIVGRIESLQYLSAEEVANIHWILVAEFANTSDPMSPPGVRDQNLLEGAMGRPQTSLGGQYKYPTAPMASAALLHSLILDHAFYNGNKRTALVACLVFLQRNRYLLESPELPLLQFIVKVAKHDVCDDFEGPYGADREVHAIAKWIECRTRQVEIGDRVMKFRDLRRILAHAGCEFQVLSGSRILITRQVTRDGWFKRQGHRLQSHNYYGGAGRDVDVNTVQKIRHELWLDEDHGVDSKAFYGELPGVDEFIAKYRMTLQRLAKW